MASVTFVAFDGATRTVEAEPHQSVMQAAVANRVAGIDGTCGGAMACGSCHVHVAPQWRGGTGSPSEFEQGMLAASGNTRPDSRLSCQIVMSEDLDGLVVHLPEFQNV